MLKGKRILLIVAGGIAAFKSLELIRRLRERGASVRCVLTEGKKRQIRRMCELLGLTVVGLKRVRMGRVKLGALPLGQWRYLGRNESFVLGGFCKRPPHCLATAKESSGFAGS